MSLTFLALLWLSTAHNAQDTDKALEQEVAAFQGTWSLASGTIDGKPMSDVDVKRYKRKFQGDRFELHEDGKTIMEGTFKLNVKQDPKTIDLIFLDKDKKEQRIYGIYKLEDDSATHCLNGEARPASFASEPKSGNILFVWQRDK